MRRTVYPTPSPSPPLTSLGDDERLAFSRFIDQARKMSLRFMNIHFTHSTRLTHLIGISQCLGHPVRQVWMPEFRQQWPQTTGKLATDQLTTDQG